MEFFKFFQPNGVLKINVLELGERIEKMLDRIIEYENFLLSKIG